MTTATPEAPTRTPIRTPRVAPKVRERNGHGTDELCEDCRMCELVSEGHVPVCEPKEDICSDCDHHNLHHRSRRE